MCVAINVKRVKVKVVLQQATKAQRGSTGIALLLLLIFMDSCIVV